MTGRAPIVTLDEALALPDPADCLAPGTRYGKLPRGASRAQCGCDRHREIHRARHREYRRDRRGAPRDGAGVGWVVGVNALPFGPLEERLVRAGLLSAASVHPKRMVELGHPFPGEVHLLSRCRDRGWATLHEVDRICIRVLQIHPALVYGQDWHQLETGESL